MGLITGGIQIGRSALMAYQSALQIVGNNIANVGTEAYTRQSAILTPVNGLALPEGFQPGGGVALSGLQRNVDESLENRYRIALGDQAAAQVRQDTIGRIESSMNELSESDISTLLQKFFNAFSSLQTKPDDVAARGIVLTDGAALVQEIQRQREDVIALRDQLNSDLQHATSRANQIADDIAQLNIRIAELEGTSRGMGGALRDQRDQLLRELGTLVQIQIREQPGGSINVYVGNELLIQAGMNRGLTTTLNTDNGYPRVDVRFADNNSMVEVRGGKIHGIIEARDTLLDGQIDQLDGLSRALIFEVNKVHAQGQGLEGFTNVAGTNDVRDAAAVLNSAAAGLDLVPRNGSFKMTVKDQDTGLAQDFIIHVDLDGIGVDDSLSSLVARINGTAQNAQAFVTGDNRLRILADNGFEITFSEDSSNVLASLGINTFFTGRSSQDIGLNPELLANKNLLAAANGAGPGDNSGAIAALGNGPIKSLNNQSISDFYNAIVANVAVKGSAAKSTGEATASIAAAIGSQRESISGVNLDEETILLLKLERAFQGAARYTTTVNSLIDQLMALVR